MDLIRRLDGVLILLPKFECLLRERSSRYNNHRGEEES
jgi:hypothetical protein